MRNSDSASVLQLRTMWISGKKPKPDDEMCFLHIMSMRGFAVIVSRRKKTEPGIKASASCTPDKREDDTIQLNVPGELKIPLLCFVITLPQ